MTPNTEKKFNYNPQPVLSQSSAYCSLNISIITQWYQSAATERSEILLCHPAQTVIRCCRMTALDLSWLVG